MLGVVASISTTLTIRTHAQQLPTKLELMRPFPPSFNIISVEWKINTGDKMSLRRNWFCRGFCDKFGLWQIRGFSKVFIKTSFKSSNCHFCCNFYLQGHCCKKVIDVGLYNITADPYEMVNLRKKFPDIVEALMTRVEFYRQSAVPPENKPIENLARITARLKGYWGPWKD